METRNKVGQPPIRDSLEGLDCVLAGIRSIIGRKEAAVAALLQDNPIDTDPIQNPVIDIPLIGPARHPRLGQDERPFRLTDGRSYTTPGVVGPLMNHRREYGFTSYGYCTERQAFEMGYRICPSQGRDFAAVWFQDHRGYEPARFYNEEQLVPTNHAGSKDVESAGRKTDDWVEGSIVLQGSQSHLRQLQLIQQELRRIRQRLEEC